MQSILDRLCNKLRCYNNAMDMEKLDYARDMLSILQNREIFDRILGPETQNATDIEPADCLPKIEHTDLMEISVNDTKSTDTLNCEELGEEECTCTTNFQELIEDIPENCWHGYFQGFQIVSEADEFNINENKKCIEITKNNCDEDLDAYLRAGIRCFMIDLFSGTEIENQIMIVRLRENELKISKEYGFPVSTTLIAKLSPRLQYIGLLKPPNAVLNLEKGDEITLTTDRYWSTRGSIRRVYVNALFLLNNMKLCDFLLVGPNLQLKVKQLLPDRLRCIVYMPGQLKSRLPVLFPPRCNKFRVSMEELEDITFAKEVGINVIVSYIVGSKEYYDNLHECLQLLKCDNMRLCARLVLNEIKGYEDDMSWAAESYDGFIIELNPQGEVTAEQNGIDGGEIMHLCPSAVKFMERAYALQKPIILDPTYISDHSLIIDPAHYVLVYYYPDKYVFKCDHLRQSFYFDYMQNALFAPLPNMQLATMLYCDESHTGSNTLARACAAASIESSASAIFVVSLTGRMAMKIAHFRPKVPIIFITRMKSASDFISMYHNIVMLYFHDIEKHEHLKSVYKHMLFGIVYAKSRRLVHNDQNVLLVYGKEEGTKFPDKYVIYKFHDKYFAEHLNQALFTS